MRGLWDWLFFIPMLFIWPGMLVNGLIYSAIPGIALGYAVGRRNSQAAWFKLILVGGIAVGMALAMTLHVLPIWPFKSFLPFKEAGVGIWALVHFVHDVIPVWLLAMLAYGWMRVRAS